MPFKSLDIENLTDNPWKLIGKDWMLVTAGNPSSWNTMTASWGGVGVLWNQKVAFVFVRPIRHTFSFMEKGERFTLSFLPEEHRDILKKCGAVSGRDTDKAALTGLQPFEPAPGVVSFEQARLVLVCRKMYAQSLNPRAAIDPTIKDNYPKGDWHKMYVAQIESAWGKQ
jgi:flavin reductase (DIM6/NTAB) family NADH-FMN oxidoreductase RutF